MDASTINAVNRAFWSGRSEIVARQMGDDVLRAYALEEVRGELLRGFPPGLQRNLEAILERADGLRRSSAHGRFERKRGWRLARPDGMRSTKKSQFTCGDGRTRAAPKS